MRAFLLVFACLAHHAHARRVQSNIEDQVNQDGYNAIAALLLANPLLSRGALRTVARSVVMQEMDSTASGPLETYDDAEVRSAEVMQEMDTEANRPLETYDDAEVRGVEVMQEMDSEVSRPLETYDDAEVRGVEVIQEMDSEASRPLETYDDAEARGVELFQAGEHERAIRMFELAQTLPGDGVDMKRTKQGGMIGSATAPPNPRELTEYRFATAEQKLIASYNIACCYAAMGDKLRAIEMLNVYAAKAGEPIKQINEMLVDPDLVMLREELQALRNEYKKDGKQGFELPFGLSFKNPMKGIAESVGVEWKD